jgi:hypothetical protein
MVEAHDAFRELPPDFHLYRVPVPDDISFDKFDLTKTDVDRLYHKAAQVKVNWETDSLPSGKPRTFDPNPQQALTFGIEQGAALIQRHYSPDMWAQSVEQTVNFFIRAPARQLFIIISSQETSPCPSTTSANGSPRWTAPAN